MILAAGPVVALAVLVVGAYYNTSANSFVSTDDAFVGPLVHVAPQVAGRVLRVLVTDDQAVQAGDLLVEIEPNDFAAALLQAGASAAEARGRLEQARSQLLAAMAARTLARTEVVAAWGSGGNAAAQRTAELQLTAAQVKELAAAAQVNFARAQIETVAAGVLVAEVAVERARIRLAHTQIRAPRTGRVRTRSIEPGDYVQVGQELLALGSDDRGSPTPSRQRFVSTRTAAKFHSEAQHPATEWSRAAEGGARAKGGSLRSRDQHGRGRRGPALSARPPRLSSLIGHVEMRPGGSSLK